MTIKKLVVGSMFSMLLGSGVANADWGDVYYCQMTQHVGISSDGEMTRYTLERFQFKLDQVKNAMVFGNKGYLTNEVHEVDYYSNEPRELLMAQGELSHTSFNNSKFMFSHVHLKGLMSITADCDKF
jgi:hypothetical protein